MGGAAAAAGTGVSGAGADAAPDGAIGACPEFAPGVSGGAVAEPAITEASGVVASRKNAGVLWVHNDSGDRARVFALGTDGAALGTFNVPVLAADWEDMALGPGPISGQDYLYLGDIGDNPKGRGGVLVHRIPEPDVAGAVGTLDVSDVETFTLRYPDHAHDAEALLVDPITADLFIVTKEIGEPTRVFAARAPLDASAPTTMQDVTELGFGPLVVAGDVSRSGDWVIVKSYPAASLWRRPAGLPLEAAFATEPCSVPVEAEPQGESIGFAADGSGYYTVSEGSAQPVYFYARR